MKTIEAPVLAIIWDHYERLTLCLPFGVQEGAFCLRLGPELFAEFQFNDPAEGTVGNFADAWEVLPKEFYRSAYLKRIGGPEMLESLPLLSVINAPMHRGLVEKAHSSKLVSDFLTKFGLLVLFQEKHHTILDPEQVERLFSLLAANQ